MTVMTMMIMVLFTVDNHGMDNNGISSNVYIDKMKLTVSNSYPSTDSNQDKNNNNTPYQWS